MSKFTPGPWWHEPSANPRRVDNPGFSVRAREKDGATWHIAATIEGIDGYPDEANARLVAAAPEMYKILEALANPLMQIAGPEALDHYAGEARALKARIDGEAPGDG